jgi:hypothetical protein
MWENIKSSLQFRGENGKNEQAFRGISFHSKENMKDNLELSEIMCIFANGNIQFCKKKDNKTNNHEFFRKNI